MSSRSGDRFWCPWCRLKGFDIDGTTISWNAGSIEVQISKRSFARSENRLSIRSLSTDAVNEVPLEKIPSKQASKKHDSFSSPDAFRPVLKYLPHGEFEVSYSIKCRIGHTSEYTAELSVMYEKQKDSASKHSVSIIGSCVSRDNFNSILNPSWRTRYDVISQFYQMSFISLFSPPIQFHEEDFIDLSNYDLDLTRGDFTKSYLRDVIKRPPDVLIIDFRADVRFGIIELENSFITDNLWKVGKSAHYQSLSNCRRLDLMNNESEYLKLFEQALNLFVAFKNRYLNNTLIVLNSARASDSYLAAEGKVRKNWQAGSSRNHKWDLLEEKFQSMVPDSYVVDAWSDAVLCDISHPWGLGPVHFEQGFYDRFDVSLRQILGEKITHRIV